MISVTAKKLRDNLSEYLDRLQSGEEVVIIRHSEIVGTLKPAQNTEAGNGASVSAMLNRNEELFKKNRKLINASMKSKEAYHDALALKYR